MRSVLLLTNVPTPYRIQLFNEVDRQFAESGIVLKIVFGAAGYSRRKWKIDWEDCHFDFEVLGTKRFALSRDAEFTTFTYDGMIRLILKTKPDLVIVPGFSLATVKLWLLSFFCRTPYLIWSGSIPRPRLNTKGRLWQRWLLARRAEGGIAYGTLAKQYLASLGVPEERIEIAINTVDTRFYQEETERLRRGAQLCREEKYLTYIGYLNRRKNVHRALEAVALLARKRDDFMLEIIGDGEDLPNLQAYVKRQNLSEHVIFHGYKQKEELPRYLARSRGLLFQTDFDIWGLVLVEAMAAGLPVISSTHAGATHDLVEDGVTGFALDFAEVEKVVERINWILDHPEEAAEMGRNAQHYVEEHATLCRSAEGFLRAVSAALPERMPVRTAGRTEVR